MIFVGIDIAAEKHDCCILSESQTVLRQFSFPNSAEGFAALLAALPAPAETKIGLESTGNYGSVLSDFLRRNGYELCTLNPLLIKKSIQATTLRKTKTDKADARFLALYLLREHPQPDLPTAYHISELKSLSRIRFSLVQQRSAAKTRAKALLVQLFPEFSSAFSDIFGAAAAAVLRRWPSAAAIAGCRTDVLARELERASRGRFGREKAAELRALAKRSVGVRSASAELSLGFLLDEIRLRTEQITRCEAELKALMDELGSPITTVPGIGTVLGAMILGEIGGIERFRTPAKLLAFAGLDPSVRQSGKSVNGPGAMVKRGSRYLRWALIQAARSVSLHDPVFAAYLETKLRQGKHYNVACSHLAKKLARIIFALLKNNSLYSPFYPLLAA